MPFLPNAIAKIYRTTDLINPVWIGFTDSNGRVIDAGGAPPSLQYGDYIITLDHCDYDLETLSFNIPTDTLLAASVGCTSSITTHETIYNHALISNGINLNLLKIYNINIFTEIVSGSGLITSNLANGSVRLDIPTNNSTASLVEQSKSILSGIPRIIIFRMGTLNFAGDSSSTFLLVGLSEFGLSGSGMTSIGHFTGVRIPPLGLTPRFYTNSTFSDVGGINLGDILIIYATSTRCSLFINGIHQVTHTITIPTNAIGHMIGLMPTIGFMGGGSNVTIDYML